MKLPVQGILNNITKPILFVAIITILVAYFYTTIQTWQWYMQFLLVGLPISFVVFYYFGKQHDGLAAIIALFLGALSWDLVMPPYAVDLAGVLSSQAMLSGTATDYFIASIWQAIGFSGFVLYFLTYTISFAILYVLATILMKIAKRK
jgi:hypothetical protein